ncbi:probable sodium/metabolite cotransporter BASS1, chloroplastic isoform X1 [Zingiber officinale]|uniref:probable sodium/metabolite cotransporter BASS1, chloroplastic isoform X1 n=1 Tax=Zingiber officinale TaxID=94328 RepID=UPI001C4CF72C|nr:probable sodium/metabolite cotransporter BASS1, chloroplastic isoform X1 [Zingiber officinale]
MAALRQSPPAPRSPSSFLSPLLRTTTPPFYLQRILPPHRPLLLVVPTRSTVDGRGQEEGIWRRPNGTGKPVLPLLCAASDPPSASGETDVSLRGIMLRAGEVLSMAFPLWVGTACCVALWRPSSFLWVDKNLQIFGLTLTMLGMGMTLTLQDLRAALLMPKELASGFILQYTVMPLSSFFVSKLLKLPAHYAAGLILVGCCPGGTASNIVTYLARGNVALSVLMTAVSTFAAVVIKPLHFSSSFSNIIPRFLAATFSRFELQIMTPFLTSKLAGRFVAVDPVGLFMSTVQVVLAPVLLGAVLNQYCNSLIEFVSPVMPLIAVATVALLCGSAIAQNASAILSSGLQVVISVACLHGSGFFFGYVLARVLGIDVSSSRTISIEVGMQNSMLGVVLAGQQFGNPLTAVPCAVSSVCQAAYGSILAGIWRSMIPKTEEKD